MVYSKAHFLLAAVLPARGYGALQERVPRGPRSHAAYLDTGAFLPLASLMLARNSCTMVLAVSRPTHPDVLTITARCRPMNPVP